jgi:membrane protein implicated in regulation of membrane protease activity
VSRPHLPTTVTRIGLIALVIAIALIGHWVIPSGLGIVTKSVAIALLILIVLWLIRRWTRRRDTRR